MKISVRRNNLHKDYILYSPEITHPKNLTPTVITGYVGGKEGKKEDKKDKRKRRSESRKR